MHKHATHQPIYLQTESGVLVQIGNTSDFSNQDSFSCLTVKHRGISLQNLYHQNGLAINPTSGLAQLIGDATNLSDSWFCNDMSGVTALHLFSAAQLDRIATAALPLGMSDKAKALLTDLLSGSLDLLSRANSKAKNTLWELELWQVFSKLGMSASLEEPDIVVSFEGARIGIACKKIYSERNVSKVLSQAVSQIEGAFSFGLVALNLDDLTPPNTILKAASINQISETIAGLNFEFLKRHERYLRNYLEPGRAIAILVSSMHASPPFGTFLIFRRTKSVSFTTSLRWSVLPTNSTNLSVNQTACKLRLQVSSALCAPARLGHNGGTHRSRASRVTPQLKGDMT